MCTLLFPGQGTLPLPAGLIGKLAYFCFLLLKVSLRPIFSQGHLSYILFKFSSYCIRLHCPGFIAYFTFASALAFPLLSFRKYGSKTHRVRKWLEIKRV